MTADEHASRTVQPPALSLVTVPMPHDLAGPVTPMSVPVPPIRMARALGLFSRVSAPCAVSAKRDGSFPHPHCQCLAACGSDGGREAVMHPAGEHLDGDRIGPSWTYLLQIAAFDPTGQLGQRRLQDVQ